MYDHRLQIVMVRDFDNQDQAMEYYNGLMITTRFMETWTLKHTRCCYFNGIFKLHREKKLEGTWIFQKILPIEMIRISILDFELPFKNMNAIFNYSSDSK